MGWERAIITDSGGFQVFSLAHGNVADEIKGRRGGAGAERRACSRSPSAGSRFRSYIDGSERFMGPEESMAVQAALGSDIALAFDECTPVPRRPRLHGALDRAHPPLARPLPRLARASTGPRRQAVFGIVQGGVHEDLRRESAEAVAAAAVDGIAIGGTLGRDKAEMHGVLDDDRCRMLPAEAPKHLLGIGEPDDLRRRDRARDRRLRLRRADPPRPPRDGAGAAARARFRFDVAQAPRSPTDEAPLVEGCPCPTCAAPHAAPTSTTSPAPRS